MTFEKALKELKAGKKIRRKNYLPDRPGYTTTLCDKDNLAEILVSFADLLAEDWEVVE